MMDPELRERIRRAWRVSRENLGWDIWFYAPSFAPYEGGRFAGAKPLFPSISITGRWCALRCEHCGGVLLRGMIPARTPEKLLEVLRELSRRGCVGCLISGGCTPRGDVPLGRFVDAIAEAKRELGLTILVHTGIISRGLAARLGEAGVDAALIDIIGSDETIRSVYHLNASVDDYEGALEALEEAGVPTVPHVIVGLHYGKLKGEINALRMVSRHKPAALVIIALIPIPGTGMSGIEPPKPEEIAGVIADARLLMEETPIALGCMRPKGAHRTRTDLLALEAGVNAIAYPTREAVERAEDLGLKVHFSPVCCSQVYVDINR